jgi:hypothetical protein
MTTDNPAATEGGPGDSSLPRVLLTLLAVALASACIFLILAKALFPGVLPASWSAPQKAEDRQVAVNAAARKVTLAFLDVDYRDMDPRIDKVLKLATGTFKEQYAKTRVNLTAAAQQGKATSTGAIKYVGISDIDADSALVFVAADSKVDNSAMEDARKKGQNPDDQRYYRFQLKMSLVHGHWLLNGLDLVS